MAEPTAKLAAFVLALVGGILALVEGVRPVLNLRFGGGNLDLALLIAGGAVAMLGAMRGWKGAARDGAVLCLVGGVLALLGGGDLAGALVLVGAVLFFVA